MVGQIVLVVLVPLIIVIMGIQIQSAVGTLTIDMKEKTYYPEKVNVRQNEPVIWHNDDNVVHTATSGSPDDFAPGMLFNTGAVFPGLNSSPIKLNEKGEIPYFCQIHPYVTGKLLVS